MREQQIFEKTNNKLIINGNTMGKNRLDVQLAKDGVYYNME